MRQLVILFFLSLTFSLTSTATSPKRIAQEATVNYPQLGAIRIRAIEQLNTPMRLEFYSLKTKKNLATIKPSDDSMASPVSECIRFQIINDKRFAAPLIYLVTVSMGGSDGTFWGQLIGWRDNKFQVLNEEKFETAIQGGFYVGELGEQHGFGVAVWQFLWCPEEDSEPNCREAHYDNHRYELRLYPLDVNKLIFQTGVVMRTKNKHDGHGEKALTEFGFSLRDLRKDNPRLRKMME